MGVNRVRFLLDSLADLDASLRKLNSRLLVLQGTPQDVLPGLCAQVPVPGLRLGRLNNLRVREAKQHLAG